MNTMDTHRVDINAMYDIARRSGCKTKIEIAKKMSMNRNTVGKILEGKELPSSTFMYKFVDAFSVESSVAGLIFFNQSLRNT